jgi:hypothetical protein
MKFRANIFGVLVVASTLAACASQPNTATSTPAVAPPPPAAAVAAKPLRAPKDIGMSEILDDPKKLAVLRKHAPAIADHEQIGMARGMSLADVAGYAEAGLTPQMVNAIIEDLSKL